MTSTAETVFSSLKSKIKGLAGLVSPVASPLGWQMPIFSLCPCVAFALCLPGMALPLPVGTLVIVG